MLFKEKVTHEIRNLSLSQTTRSSSNAFEMKCSELFSELDFDLIIVAIETLCLKKIF